MKRKKYFLLSCILALMLSIAGCGQETSTTELAIQQTQEQQGAPQETKSDTEESPSALSLADIPSYTGSPFIEINGNQPGFTDADKTTESFETYSSLDPLGRCGVAYANIGQDIMPTEERDSISEVKPSGWQSVEYDGIDGGYLYNRCHLIGYQLTAENANEKNLITGTRYMNTEGMLPFENLVADYVRETGNHVLYRVNPIFYGDNLVASGVQMEAMSVEDDGAGILFNVYCYNVQPSITIDYATGDSVQTGEYPAKEGTEGVTGSAGVSGSGQEEEHTYILNTNTLKFHKPDCSSINQMSEHNKGEFSGTRDEMIAQGYEPCKNCNP